jgi:hypothetical protein
MTHDNDTDRCSYYPVDANCDGEGEWQNELTPMLVDAIAEFIAGTPDPCAVTDLLEAALLKGGMTHNQISWAVEKFLPQDPRGDRDRER